MFNSIEALANRANSASEIESFFNGHVSSKGNQIIAEVLYDFLKENSLNAREWHNLLTLVNAGQYSFK